MRRLIDWIKGIPASIKLALGSFAVGAGAFWVMSNAVNIGGLINTSAHGVFMTSLAILSWCAFDRYAMSEINLGMVADRSLPASTRAGIVIAYALFFLGICSLWAAA